jgi:YbgC/YbaW family acyl-CoA thioester hydrolase
MTVGQIYKYPVTIKEVYLDAYGHVNNTAYLTLFEEARWDLITKNGYGFEKIKETGFGPVLLEVSMRYLKELCARDEIVIESQMISYEKKVGKMTQVMKRGEEVCCTAEFKIGFFNIRERKLALPTPEWIKAIGLSSDL